jgi:hypothetical protein
MKTIKLKKVEHNVKTGTKCPYYEPNITEDCLLEYDGDIIGFYISDVSKYSKKLPGYIGVANAEFRSKNVPKSKMNRSDTMKLHKQGLSWAEASKFGVSQYSTIIGSIPPRPHMRRNYRTSSSVHGVKTARTFIKAMFASANESEKIIQKLTPEIYKKQKDLMQNVNMAWKIGELFTSSISNYNISAGFHRDTGNIKGCVNVIITKRHNSKGGCLNVPDFNATFEQKDNSMLVYPAWMNTHGVTPIIPTADGGYRNSLIFYSLKAFVD